MFSVVSFPFWPSLALAFSPGPPWPLTSCCPLPCCSFPTLLHVARCYAIFSLSLYFVHNPPPSRVSIRPRFFFSSPWLLFFLLPLFLSRRARFTRAGVNGSVLSTLSPFFSAGFTGCYSIFACVLLSLLRDFWRTCFCRSAQFLICVCFHHYGRLFLRAVFVRFHYRF